MVALGIGAIMFVLPVAPARSSIRALALGLI